MKKIKKEFQTVITCLLLMCTIFSSILPVSAAKSYDVNEVVWIAESYLGSTSFGRGTCLKFVRMMHQEAYGFYSSACCAYKYGTSYIDSTRQDNIPIGADVFFSGSSSTCSSCRKKCGHVGIYVGDGYIIHNWSGKIQKHKISAITKNGSYSYRGWGWHGNKSFATVATENKSLKTNTYYEIKNVKSGKLLNVFGSKSASNTNVTVYQKDGTSGQAFKLIKKGANRYIIVAKCAPSCALNVYGNSAKNDSNVNIWKKTGNDTQEWILESVTGGYLIRSADNPKYVLTASGTSNSSNVKLTTYSSGNKYQIWKFN